MKLNKFFAAFLLLAGMVITSCVKVPEPTPGPGNQEEQPGQNEQVDWSKVDVPEGAITVAEALEKAGALESGAVTTEAYYVKGIIKKFANKHADGIASYGNALFYMIDNEGDENDFYAYQVYGKGGQKFVSEDQLAVGDLVVVYCHLTNYNGTLETVGKGDGYVYASSNPNFDKGDVPPTPTEITDVTIPEAIAIASALEAGKKTTENYRITNVIVDTVFTKATDVTKYGNINLLVKDAEGNEISCYYTNNIDNQKFTSSTQLPKKGATVTIVGPLKNYLNKTTNEGTPEFENAWFTAISEVVGGEEVTPGPSTDPVITPAEGLTNVSFEEWGEDGYPTGWKSNTTASNAKPTETLVKADDAHTGDSSVKLLANTANKRLASQEVTLAAGKYKFSVFVKAPAGETGANVVAGYVPLKADGSGVGSYVYGTYVNGATEEWQETAVEFELSAETIVNFVVMNNKSGNKAVLIDDATLVKVQ